MELAGSRFASARPHFGSRAFWRENMEHLVEADRSWRYTMGEQVPESFIMSQLLGLLLPSAKTTSAEWCSWQIRCRLFEARPFFVVFCRETWAGAIGDCVIQCVDERAALSRKQYQHVALLPRFLSFFGELFLVFSGAWVWSMSWLRNAHKTLLGYTNSPDLSKRA